MYEFSMYHTVHISTTYTCAHICKKYFFKHNVQFNRCIISAVGKQAINLYSAFELLLVYFLVLLVQINQRL